MPFCPKCRAEYREGFTLCSDCAVDLVDELPPEPPPEHKGRVNNERLIRVVTAPNEPFARMWADILKQHNIVTLIKRVPPNWMGNGFPALNDICEIYVLASQAGIAKRILIPLIDIRWKWTGSGAQIVKDYCRECGTKLIESPAACPACSQKPMDTDLFCRTCGEPLAFLPEQCPNCGVSLLTK